MSDEIKYYDDTPSGSEMTMMETWIAAVTKPKVDTFVRIAAQSGATMGKAFLWAFVAILISSFASSLAQVFSAGSQMDRLRGILPPEIAREIPASVTSSAGGISTVICGAPIAAVMGVLVFAIMVALIQWAAKLFGGTGSFEKLFYTFSTILVPMAVVSAVLSLLTAIPYIGICFGVVALGLGVYQIVLQVLAVQAVNGLDTGKAVGSVLLPIVIFFLFICCCVAIFTLVLGPAVGNVFNGLQ